MLALALAALLLEPLAGRHRVWFSEEVPFLISSEERARFEALSTTDERDRFIESFWRRRDPTPGTLRNEAREEHGARLAACDRLFLSPDRGRLSERGRVYQLLGPPAFRESFTASRERLVPVELWHYTGVTVSFLPDAFYLVFFRRDGQGPFRLWSPATDGAEALLRDPEPGRFSLGDGPTELSRVDPELAAAVSEGLVPGPPARSVSLLAAIGSFADLAERERALSSAISASVDFRTLEASLDVAVFFDDAGVAELHYALALAPGQSERLSWRLTEGRLLGQIALAGRLSRDGRELDRWEDELVLEVRDGSTESLDRLSFSFRGRRLLAPGASHAVLSIASPGGAFAVEETSLPDPGLVVVAAAGEVDETSPSGVPFHVGHLILLPGVVPRGRDGLALFQTRGDAGRLSWELYSGQERLWSESESLDVGGSLLERTLPTAGLPNGSYRLRVRGPERTAEAAFRIGTPPPGDERVIAREPTAGEEARYRRARAEAFLRAGRRDRAIEEMERALASGTGELARQLELATLRFAAGRCEEVLRQLRPLADEARDPDVFVLLAACSESLGDLRSAETSYARALALSPDDPRIRAALDRLRRRNN